MSDSTLHVPSATGAPASERRDGRAAAWVTVLASLVAVTTYGVFVRTEWGQRLDESALVRIDAPPRATLRIAGALNDLTIGAALAVLVGCVLIAITRRRYPWAIGAVALVLGANATTQLSKRLLPRPDLGHGALDNSLPSGHATVALSLVLAVLVVLPYTARGLVVLAGSVAVTVVGVGMVVAGWHRPSDVVAAYAVCAVWAGLVSGWLLTTRSAMVRRRERRAHRAPALLGAVVAVALAYAYGVRPDGSWEDLVVHGATVAGIGLAGALALSVSSRVIPAGR